jgi:hypothetical protein
MMIGRILIVAAIWMGMLSITSCESEKGPEYSFYPIAVDSIQVDKEIQAGEPFEIRFYGVVGTDGCHQFSRFHKEMNTAMLSVELWGRRTTGENIECPDVMVFLEGRALKLRVDQPGEYILEVRQPDGDPLERNIQVEPS